MLKSKKLTIIFLIFLVSCKAKELTEEMGSIHENAITVKNLSELNKKIYKEISSAEIIMLGEMHGTNEPSEFALGLCTLIAENEGKVILGMEISPSQMESFSDALSLAELKQLKFFNGENSSGMNGETWLNLIHQSNKNEGIITKFIDAQNFAPRDSAMYQSILELRQSFPKTKIVTLTGNLHNWLVPYKDQLMLGAYLMKDSLNFDQEKIISIMHIFNQGTMLNNTGNGLELKTIEGKENVFNSSVSANMFFGKNPYEDYKHFTHYIYTDKVSHSNVLEGQ